MWPGFKKYERNWKTVHCLRAMAQMTILPSTRMDGGWGCGFTMHWVCVTLTSKRRTKGCTKCTKLGEADSQTQTWDLLLLVEGTCLQTKAQPLLIKEGKTV